ncbi:hypothetical protein O4H52_20120 [Sphingomonadaceae bacterium G21617-S1]|nr:hypothetical protein [Sphingomonadaceae bacterium G21617-S1]
MPWRHMGKQVRLPMPQPILRKHVHLSGPGHITQLRVRVLRPCFGSPTAFLRHGGVRLIARREKPPFKSRCTYCHAREGCEKVAVYRLYNNSEVRALLGEWHLAGGREALERHDNNHAQRKWRDLIAALNRAGPFLSPVDGWIDEHIVAEDARIREEDRVRQAEARARLRAEKATRGELDEIALDRLKRERIFRQVQFDVTKKEASAPAWLSKGPTDTGAFTAKVWEALKRLELQGIVPNPSNIAGFLINHDLTDRGNQNALRDRTRRAFDRIEHLEHYTPPGRLGPLWPPLKAAQLLEDEDVPGLKDLVAAGFA